MIITAIIVIIIVILVTQPERDYKKTNYYNTTHNPYQKVRSDLGLFGEYMCYKYLMDYEKTGARFLFNTYIPRENDTTEVDIIMIHSTGLYVLESKNYSGWIFGTDTNQYWTQTLPQGNKSIKEKFLNPVKQNETHIKYLKKLLGEGVPFYSIVVFSERCTFKSLTVKQDADYKVIQRNYLRRTIDEIASRPPILTSEQIESIYNQLYPYTQVTETVKQEHIQHINQRINQQQNVQPITVPVVNAPVTESSVTSEPIPFTEEPTDFFCPDCGAAIILKTAQGGENVGKQFYYCTNYPKCTYVKERI